MLVDVLTIPHVKKVLLDQEQMYQRRILSSSIVSDFEFQKVELKCQRREQVHTGEKQVEMENTLKTKCAQIEYTLKTTLSELDTQLWADPLPKWLWRDHPNEI